MATTMPGIELEDRFAGLLLGTAVGDALGLPSEGLTAEQIRRRWKGQWTMRFIFGRGMVSDDTEHTLMVAQALLSHPGDVDGLSTHLGLEISLVVHRPARRRRLGDGKSLPQIMDRLPDRQMCCPISGQWSADAERHSWSILCG